jgi:hypothetical protein
VPAFLKRHSFRNLVFGVNVVPSGTVASSRKVASRQLAGRGVTVGGTVVEVGKAVIIDIGVDVGATGAACQLLILTIFPELLTSPAHLKFCSSF